MYVDWGKQQAEGKHVAPCQTSLRTRNTILKNGETDCKATSRSVQVIYAVQPSLGTRPSHAEEEKVCGRLVVSSSDCVPVPDREVSRPMPCW